MASLDGKENILNDYLWEYFLPLYLLGIPVVKTIWPVVLGSAQNTRSVIKAHEA